MRSYDEIHAIAAERHGGTAALEALIRPALSREDVAATSDDRWLAEMTRCIFQAGFNWRVVDGMWPAFEEVFDGFDVRRCAFLHDEELEKLASDRRIVRNLPKIRTVRENAAFLAELAGEGGAAARVFADWPDEDYVGLLEVMRKRGARLGGMTGQRVLRNMGRDAFILSRDVVARLVAEGVVDREPSSKADMRAVQRAFDAWRAQSGRGMSEISQVLARSIGA